MGEGGARRLVGILAADVVGYSRLIGDDEPGTLARLRAMREEVLDPLLTAHGGRVFKSMGDGLLAEFRSGVQAVQCAIALQQALAARADGLQLRIGLHSADVVVQHDGDLLGDGINIAARLEALADPGGICISERIREDAAGKIAFDVEDLGTPALKNIARPVRVYRVVPGRAPPNAAAVAAMAREGPATPRPSIAVLPFANLSGDAEQEYFADGLTEDILTALTRFAQLTVIARNSTFVYKGRAVSIADVGRDLRVRYVLEGSVRRSGDRVRVTAQLIEAATSAHLWAERYDRALTDIFALQDEITERIVTTLVSNIERSIIEQARRRPPESFDAYELFLHGREQRNMSQPDAMVAAEALFDRAVALDPGFASAYAEIAYIQYIYVTWRWDPERRDAHLSKGFASARRALALEASLPLANRALGMLHLRAREYADAVQWTQRAVALNPGEAESYAWLANVLSYVGRSAEALEQLGHATRLDPLHPPLWDFYIGRALVHLGRYEEALTSLDIGLRRAPHFGHFQRYRAAALAHLGRLDEVRATLSVPMPIGIYIYRTIGDVRRWDSYLESIEFERLIEGLRKAGFPE
jgi:adenylate cyclase